MGCFSSKHIEYGRPIQIQLFTHLFFIDRYLPPNLLDPNETIEDVDPTPELQRYVHAWMRTKDFHTIVYYATYMKNIHFEMKKVRYVHPWIFLDGYFVRNLYATTAEDDDEEDDSITIEQIQNRLMEGFHRAGYHFPILLHHFQNQDLRIAFPHQQTSIKILDHETRNASTPFCFFC